MHRLAILCCLTVVTASAFQFGIVKRQTPRNADCAQIETIFVKNEEYNPEISAAMQRACEKFTGTEYMECYSTRAAIQNAVYNNKLDIPAKTAKISEVLKAYTNDETDEARVAFIKSVQIFQWGTLHDAMMCGGPSGDCDKLSETYFGDSPIIIEDAKKGCPLLVKDILIKECIRDGEAIADVLYDHRKEDVIAKTTAIVRILENYENVENGQKFLKGTRIGTWGTLYDTLKCTARCSKLKETFAFAGAQESIIADVLSKACEVEWAGNRVELDQCSTTANLISSSVYRDSTVPNEKNVEIAAFLETYAEGNRRRMDFLRKTNIDKWGTYYQAIQCKGAQCWKASETLKLNAGLEPIFTEDFSQNCLFVFVSGKRYDDCVYSSYRIKRMVYLFSGIEMKTNIDEELETFLGKEENDEKAVRLNFLKTTRVGSWGTARDFYECPYV